MCISKTLSETQLPTTIFPEHVQIRALILVFLLIAKVVNMV